MNIAVTGLGLIGGSLALALKRAGHFVAGKNRSPGPLEYALSHGVVDAAADDVSGFDVVFVALPPRAAAEYICTAPFGENTVVADICGVKRYIERQVLARRPGLKYVGTHPMAGKEVSGVENACADLFDGASMVLTRNIYTDERAYGVIKSLTAEMGFARLVECSAEVHDKKIAYTSQLAHVVSSCYVKDGEIEGCLGFTGGSFQDMTRIAGVDENVWSELYLLNADNLSGNIRALARRLDETASAIESGEESALVELLRAGREQFCERKNNSFQGRDVVTTPLARGPAQSAGAPRGRQKDNSEV